MIAWLLRRLVAPSRALLRTWRGRFIFAMVAIQLVLPLQYYLLRRDRHDERFAWRMFSPMRMTRCQPTFAIDGQPFSIDGELHEAWKELAVRGRLVVVEAIGARLCAEHPGAKVRVALACTYIDRAPVTYAQPDICTSPEL